MSMKTLVLQSDFGLDDGAVSAMHGVAKQVNQALEVSHITHNIPQYDIWTASYRLIQTVEYWPAGTVFVSVVDPGVGSHRRSIVVKTTTNHYVVTPDNGTLSHLLNIGIIESAREINEEVNRLPHSRESHTFHGRDIYAFNGARLASGEIEYDHLGNDIPVNSLEQIDITSPTTTDTSITGNIDIFDIRFGSIWTNISIDEFKTLSIAPGELVYVTIRHRNKLVYQNAIPFMRSFSGVEIGEPLLYINSLTNIGVAVNQGSFSALYNIGFGPDWHIKIKKIDNEKYYDLID